MNAPSTASTWSHWVTTPNDRAVTTTTVMPDSESLPLARTRLRALSTARCPIVNATTKNTIRPMTVNASLSSLSPPAWARPAISPRATQPITSLAMPAASVSWPKLRRISPISPRILAMTGSDEIESAAAMKRAKM